MYGIPGFPGAIPRIKCYPTNFRFYISNQTGKRNPIKEVFMKNYFATLILLSVLTSILFAQSLRMSGPSEEPKPILADSAYKQGQQTLPASSIWAKAGGNVSAYIGKRSEPGFGHNFGWSIIQHFYNDWGLSGSVLYTRQRIFLSKLKTAFVKWDGNQDNLYRYYYDFRMDLDILEVNILLHYRFWQNKKTALYIGLGPGYSIVAKDRSKSENFVGTDIIVREGPGVSDPVDGASYAEPGAENSGYNVNLGLWLRYKQFLIQVFYSKRVYIFHGYGNAHSLFFNLGVGLNLLVGP